MAKELITALNASVSSSINEVREDRNFSECLTTDSISVCTPAYFFFPIVRLQTIDVSAAPSAPARDATLPPPGAGELEASSLINSLTVLDVSIIFPILKRLI